MRTRKPMTKIEAFEEMNERRGKLSASGMEAAFLCHGKPKAEEGKPENVMPETTAGSRIHEAVEPPFRMRRSAKWP